MERQLVEFQSLLQQKDEQIAQLMEEGKVQVMKETDQH
jgi:succinate dehydrogenase flavin-adding protein (antitoxin of CptAB toxin-antitoxin module)